MKTSAFRYFYWYVGMTGLLFSTSLFANSMPDFTKLVEKNTRSIVNISAIHHDSTENPYQPNQHRGISYGSGFIISIDNKSYIITNNHVTNKASEILVRFSDRVELLATLIGADTLTDVALLEVTDIDNKELLPVTIGSSETLKAGQWVVAIGSPFSFDYSVTAGIISALGRSLPNETYVPFIQSDVAVNQGNSGGPLFNLDGEVIGINSRIFSRTGTYAGLSFSIPMHIALDVATQLKNKGSVTRGYLGVSIRDVTRELVKSFGMRKAQGALVVEVLKNTAADTGGIRNGDIILEFQGKEIIHSGDLPVLVGRTQPGTQEEFVILREGNRKTIKLVIGSREGTIAPQAKRKNLGMGLVALDAERLASLGLNNGIGIQSIEVNGAAFKAGFQAGDIITHFYQTPVTTVDELLRLVEQTQSGSHVPLRILRNQRQPIYIALQIP